MGRLFSRLRKIAVVAACVLAAAVAAPGAWAKPAVSGVRVGENNNVTRFVLELSEQITYRIFTLADPYRVVIDLPEADWPAQGLKRPAGYIKGLRYASARPGTGRIVLDATGPVAVRQAFTIPPRDGAGWRFVLDLEQTSQAKFMQEQGAPPDLEAGQLATASAPAAPPQLAPASGTLQLPVQAAASPAPAPASSRRRGKEPREAPDPQDVPQAAAEQPMAQPRGRNGKDRPVVVIDAGHGGVDPGAIGVSGEFEKNITLAAARELKAQLDRTGRYKVVLTRDRDVFIRLRDRVAISRAAGADLFMSLHADAVSNPNTRGLSIYTLSQNASDAEAQALADKENKADLIAGLDLSHESAEVANILIDLAQRESMNHSAIFAGYVVDEMGRLLKLLDNTHRFAGFAVLKAPDVPSVLVEMGYLSNDQEEQLLRQSAYRAKLATALVHSIDRYFASTQKMRRP